ncbi:ArsR/SmtB family transcription factor [Halobacillus salinus]|uniref:Transcriptional regulator n=1 Tax=Halobacillus salinus TaxID=192814 RepID=A0A4Z0GZM2_9BACI|nr:metalloregulator ArsR/SmtB family transcription factor [Halobacillus salinus]TGB03638.1 transcriptional regulator [Halobacillus salinus]
MESTESKIFENVLIALADPTRRELLDLLALRGQATATTLATTVTVSRQAVVKHLTILKNSKLVTSDRVGREVRYKVCPQQLSSTVEWMADLAADWDRKLAWIKRIAEDDK